MSKEETKISKKTSSKKTTSNSTKNTGSSRKNTSGSVKKTKTNGTSTKNKPIKVDEITLEEADSFYHVSLLAQAMCVVGILAISVLAIFENSFTIPVEVLVGITLLIMAYNNIKLFKRKGLTIVYIIFGIICIIFGLIGYAGV